MGLTPYQYGANNPILMIDINGDSIYIYNGKEKILYHNGSLYWAGTGQKYNGNAINKKGNLTGFVSDTKIALDAIRTGGQSGQELIDYIQNGTYKDVGIQYGHSNQERSGLIDFNPSERQSDVPNQDGTYGRDSYIGLAHELGHSWDRFENGDANFSKIWYNIPGSSKSAYETEKISTWWENRIRSENGFSLREFYNFVGNNGRLVGDENTRILIPGTSVSSVNKVSIGKSPLIPMKVNYKYK